MNKLRVGLIRGIACIRMIKCVHESDRECIYMTRNTYILLVGQPEGKIFFGRQRRVIILKRIFKRQDVRVWTT